MLEMFEFYYIIELYERIPNYYMQRSDHEEEWTSTSCKDSSKFSPTINKIKIISIIITIQYICQIF